jgi:CRISPR-associated protein Csx16
MAVRLVTFLGTGRYEETTYTWQRDEATCKYRTRFVARALAEMASVSEVIVLPTIEAWTTHGNAFQEELNGFGLKSPTETLLPLGATPAELWHQFELTKAALRADRGTQVVLDITHGFRSSPFFAAAAVAFTRLVDKELYDLQVVYGAFEARDTESNTTPIWDITPFVGLLDWSRNLMLFLRTGRVAELSSAIETLGRALRKAWHLGGGQGEQPRIQKLGDALERFGNEIETVRTGSLLLGGPNNPSGVLELLNELQRSKDELPRHIPPLADVLDRLRSTVEALLTDQRLSQRDGQRALKALATLYLEMGRYPEAAATLREAWINQHACSKSDCPGTPEFSDAHREAAEKAWFAANEQLAGEIAETRNDIQHAGYRSRPQRPETIKRKIRELIGKLDAGAEPSDV